MSPIRLGQFADARSGDKGGAANVGVIAHTRRAYLFLCQHLTADCVAAYFAALHPSRVIRYEWPGLLALNFVLADVLAGGGSVNLRLDAQGKSLGQCLLEMTLDSPDDLTFLQGAEDG